MTHPTREQIEASQRICEAATEGPWEQASGKTACELDKHHVVQVLPKGKLRPIIMCLNGSDAALCAHARTELPARNQQCLDLLEENERLTNQVSRIVSILRKAVEKAEFADDEEEIIEVGDLMYEAWKVALEKGPA